METPNRCELLATARLKDRSDESLLRKIGTAQKVYWAGGALIGLIAAITIWVVTIRHDVDVHDKAIRKLWEQVFAHPLP